MLKAATALFGSLLALSLPIPSQAHHSYAMFDRTKVISITGTVRKIQRVSPHGTIWLETPNDKGAQDLWAVQLTAAGLGTRGKDDGIKAGDKLTLDINPLRDGRTGGSLVRVHFPDGRVIGEEQGAFDRPNTPSSP